jgi:hypothetical protein
MAKRFIGVKNKSSLCILTTDAYELINFFFFSIGSLLTETTILFFLKCLSVPVISRKQNNPKKNLNHNGKVIMNRFPKHNARASPAPKAAKNL